MQQHFLKKYEILGVMFRIYLLHLKNMNIVPLFEDTLYKSRTNIQTINHLHNFTASSQPKSGQFNVQGQRRVFKFY